MTDNDLNFNYEFLFSLKPAGYARWKEHDDETIRKIKAWLPLYTKQEQPVEYYLAKADSEGRVKMRLFEFVQIFGAQHVGLGSPCFSAWFRRAEEVE